MSNQVGETNLRIGDSQFTIRWMLEKLDENSAKYRQLAKEFELQNVDIKLISEGMGFLSAVYRCELQFSESNKPKESSESRKMSVCLKVPTSSKIDSIIKDQKALDELAQVHDRECEFYEKFADKLGILIPRVYSTQKLNDTKNNKSHAHILMDYLDGGANLPMNKTYTPELLRACADQMAKLHAYSIQHPDLWAEGFEPIDFGKNGDESGFAEMHDKIIKQLQEKGSPELVEAIKQLDPLVRSTNFFHFSVHKSHLDVGVCSVLIHGDLWGNNVIIKTRGGSQFTNELCGLIDWQLASSGNPAADLTRLLVLNTDAEIRREHERLLFEFYYQRLCEELKPDRPPFSFDQLMHASRAPFVMQVLGGCFLGAFHFQHEDQEEERRVFYERLREAALDAAKVIREYVHEWSI